MKNSRTRKTEFCPFCGEAVETLIRGFDVEKDDRILTKIKGSKPAWHDEAGICSRCLDVFRVEVLEESRLIPPVDSAFAIEAIGEYKIPPTPLRMNVDPNFTGKGVTICFIDSGFYLHPDLTKPKNRILETIDIATPTREMSDIPLPQEQNWHGTMTSVVCAGNGYLSAGLYKGIACDANLVLLKVQNEQGISGANITKAIRWAIKNRRKYDIRIINLSVGDDWPDSYKDSQVDQAAEEAVAAGIIVVAAVGNDPNASIKPPANSPNVISVGGLNDHNTPDPLNRALYHSTFGQTVDGFQKPEVIAPAIWIAAPILPGTADHKEAGILHQLYYAKNADSRFRKQLAENLSKTRLDPALLNGHAIDTIKAEIRSRVIQAKYISPHYLHTDGTSFAAPIVCSIIAQMLEANPALTPALVREIVLTTAQPLPYAPVARQGYGMIDAKFCVEKAQSERHTFLQDYAHSPFIDKRNHKIVFFYHDHDAKKVMLVGDFNSWSIPGYLFTA
jgi:serine protease AprX